MKKILALMLAVIMVAAVFAGCGQKSADPTEAPATTQGGETTAAPETPTEAAPEADPSDITSWILEEDTNMSGVVNFWIPFKGTQGMDAMIADFNQTYPNIQVNLNTYSNNSDGNVAVNTAIMGGEVDVLASFGQNMTYKRW